MFEAKYKEYFIDDACLKNIEAFFDYFIDSHKIIENKIKNHDRSFMQEFDDELKKIFIRYSKLLRYNFLPKGEIIEFIFYYGRNDYLLSVGTILCEKKQYYKLENWRFRLEK